AVRVATEELQPAQLDRTRPAHAAGHARHVGLVAVAVRDHGGLRHLYAAERSGEVVRVALAPDLAVADDVDAGPLHLADGHDGRVVLRRPHAGLGAPAQPLP